MKTEKEIREMLKSKRIQAAATQIFPVKTIEELKIVCETLEWVLGEWEE